MNSTDTQNSPNIEDTQITRNSTDMHMELKDTVDTQFTRNSTDTWTSNTVSRHRDHKEFELHRHTELKGHAGGHTDHKEPRRHTELARYTGHCGHMHVSQGSPQTHGTKRTQTRHTVSQGTPQTHRTQRIQRTHGERNELHRHTRNSPNTIQTHSSLGIPPTHRTQRTQLSIFREVEVDSMYSKGGIMYC